MQFLNLDSDEVEDVLMHLRNFTKLVEDLGTEEGAPMLRLFGLALSPDVKDEWQSALDVDLALVLEVKWITAPLG